MLQFMHVSHESDMEIDGTGKVETKTSLGTTTSPQNEWCSEGFTAEKARSI